MRETQQTIVDWANETFNNPRLICVATRMMCEVAELLELLTSSATTEDIWDECADIGVMLAQVALRVGVELSEVVLPPGTTMAPARVLAVELNAELARLTAEVAGLSGCEPLSTPALRASAAKAVVLLWDLARRLDAPELWGLIEKKMDKNRKRTWAQQSPGVFQHATEGQ